jgi:hypothetical protein
MWDITFQRNIPKGLDGGFVIPCFSAALAPGIHLFSVLLTTSANGAVVRYEWAYEVE